MNLLSVVRHTVHGDGSQQIWNNFLIQPFFKVIRVHLPVVIPVALPALYTNSQPPTKATRSIHMDNNKTFRCIYTSSKCYKFLILPVLPKRQISIHQSLFQVQNWLTCLPKFSYLLYECRVLRRIFGPKKDEVTEEWRKMHSEEFHILYSSPDIIR
jgi:hypothetical protein